MVDIKTFRKLISLTVACLLSAGFLYAKESGEKGFNAGEMIMHHVQDNHEIHFVTLQEGTPDETHITLPLPVIIWSESGLDVFSSSNFHNEEHSYTSEKTGNTYVLDHGHITAKNTESVYDLSITKNVIGLFITMLLMVWLFVSAARGYKKREGRAPKGIQSFLEPLILFIRDEVAKPSIGSKYEKFTPFLLSIFFFIWICNLLGLVPFLGGMNITGSIGVTMVLAFFTFVITNIYGFRNPAYVKHLLAPPGVPWWLLPIMIPIEVLGVFSKPFVLMVRLTANITAGHIIILSFVALIFIFGQDSAAAGYGVSVGSVLFIVFMTFLELLVAFLQAYVFTLLSALYFGAAVEEHH